MNSSAALSRSVVTDELWLCKKFDPSPLVLSPVNSGELIIGLEAMFVRSDEEKRSQFASLVLYPAAGNGLLTLSGVQVPVVVVVVLICVQWTQAKPVFHSLPGGMGTC